MRRARGPSWRRATRQELRRRRPSTESHAPSPDHRATGSSRRASCPVCLHTRDQRLELRRLEPLPGRIDQRLARAFSLDIPVQQRAYAGRQLERLEEFLIQPPAAGDDTDRSRARRAPPRTATRPSAVSPADRSSAGTPRRMGRAPVRRPRMAISEPRRPVRRRNDRPVVRDEIQEVETLEQPRGTRPRSRRVRSQCRAVQSRARSEGQGLSTPGRSSRRLTSSRWVASSRRNCGTSASVRCRRASRTTGARWSRCST